MTPTHAAWGRHRDASLGHRDCATSRGQRGCQSNQLDRLNRKQSRLNRAESTKLEPTALTRLFTFAALFTATRFQFQPLFPTRYDQHVARQRLSSIARGRITVGRIAPNCRFHQRLDREWSRCSPCPLRDASLVQSASSV